jgi:AraC-like DNA-binding protein
MFVIILVFAVVINVSTEKNIIESETQNSFDKLSLIKSNINNMNDILGTLNDYFYIQPETKYILDYKDPELIDLNIVFMINKYQSAVATGRFLDSIYVYNNDLKLYYTTDNGMDFNNSTLADLKSKYGTIPKNKILARKVKIDKEENNKYVFSYVNYEGVDKNNNLDGALIFNINTNWLFNSIKDIGKANNGNKDRIFILGDKNEFINDEKYEDSFEKNLKQVIDKEVKYSKLQNHFFCEINNEKFLVTYMQVQSTGWTLINTRASADVYKSVNQMRISIIVITLFVMLMVFIALMLVSNRIYKPIDSLIKKVAGNSSNTENTYGESDEIKLLDNVFFDVLEKLNKFEQDKKSNTDILKKYYLRNLLNGSELNSLGNMNVSEESTVLVDFGEEMVICLLQADKLNDIAENLEDNDRELLKFSLINIFDEILSTKFKVEAVDMTDDNITILLNTGENSEEFYEIAVKLIKEAQMYYTKYFKVSFSAVLSEIFTDVKKISKYYYGLTNDINYKLIFGKMCVITPQRIASNKQNVEFGISLEAEKQLIKSIKCGDYQSVEEDLKGIFQEISSMNYSNIMLALIYLMNSINSTVQKMNSNKLDTLNIDFEFYQHLLYQAEDIKEIYELYLKIAKEITNISALGTKSNKKYEILVYAIKDIVDANYHNSSLCLQEIADMLKMTSKYIGKIFKDDTGISVAQYINEVRIDKAVQLLQNTRYSVIEVMNKVGIEHESQFYKLFKAKFGTTPKEYVFKKTLQK